MFDWDRTPGLSLHSGCPNVLTLQVHGLFTNEELDSTLAPLKDTVASQALLGQSLYSFFTSQVQQNLRIVISMDPASPDFHFHCADTTQTSKLCTRSPDLQPTDS